MFFVLIFILIFAIAAIRDFRWGLFIFLASLPSYLIRFKIFGLPTTMLEVMFWILFFIWITRMARRGGPADNSNISVIRVGISPLVKSKIFLPVIIFFVSSIIAIWVSPNHLAALGIWRAYFLEPMIFFVMLISTVGGETANNTVGGLAAYKLVWPLAISVFYISIIAIAQRFFGLAIPSPWQAELRVTSVFDYPNAVGLFVAPILMLILGLLISRIFANCTDLVTPPHPRTPRSLGERVVRGGIIRVIRVGISPLVKSRAWFDVKTVFLVITFFLGILAIIFAKSDGAIIGLAAGLAVFGLLYNRKARLAVAVAIIVISIVILAVPGVGERVANQFLLGDWSGYVRQTMWGETWQMLKDNPLFGAGLAGYQTVFAPYHEAKGIEIFLYPHNIIFNFWSELGILGLLAFGWMIIGWFKRLQIADCRLQIFCVAATASMIVLLVHGLADVPYFKNDLAFLFWTIFAVPFLLTSGDPISNS